MIDRILMEDEIIGKLDIDLINPKTNEPYKIVAFVGENGCGKTTILNALFKQTNKTLFIRQNLLYTSSQNETAKIIKTTDDLYPTTNFKSENNFNLNDDSFEIINNIFGDSKISKIMEDGLLKDIKFGGEVSKMLNGSESSINLNNLSSGQVEIIIKLLFLLKTENSDIVLLDEPETSLHPRWQRNIVKAIQSILCIKDNTPQIFIATHSERVLETLIKDEETLIVICKKINNEYIINPIYNFKTYLPVTTLAELDYLVFEIPTMEYHDQLFNELSNLLELDNIGKIDNKIKINTLYNERYKKEWISKTTKYNGEIKINSYVTLPVYIRNYFHHPKEKKEPTELEIEKSIKFLFSILDNIRNQ